MVLLVLLFLNGCGKKYYEYSNDWVSEDMCVELRTDGTAIIKYDGVDAEKDINVLSNGNHTRLKMCYGERGEADTSECIWVVEIHIQGERMDMEIIEDNVTNKVGESICLSQKNKAHK